MHDLIVQPNLASLLVDFLMDQGEAQDILGGDYVFTELPKDKPEFMVRVTQFNDAPRSRAPHLTAAFYTVECIGGAKFTTETLARTCMALLAQRLPDVYDDCVVSACECAGLRDEPHPELVTDKGRVRPRWLFTAAVSSHPLPVAS